MKTSSKAALLSALVIPGAGHYLLKKQLRFIALTGATLLCLYVIISKLLTTAQEISGKIQSGEIPFDIQIISEKLHSQAFSGEIEAINTSLVVLVIVWLVGIFDSYRLGLKQDNRKAVNSLNNEG